MADVFGPKYVENIFSRSLKNISHQRKLKNQVFTFQFLKDKIYSYTKKNCLALGSLAKLMFWSILTFKNWKDWKVNIFLSFSGER